MTKPFIITTDASGYAIGGILSQGKLGKDQPVAYTSRVLRGAELKYDTYEKEALAMLHAVRTFKPYIFCKRFTLVTDHKPLVWFKTAELNTRLMKWRFKLSEYDYEVICRPEVTNCHADALSRNPIEVNVITRNQAKRQNLFETVNKEVQKKKGKKKNKDLEDYVCLRKDPLREENENQEEFVAEEEETIINKIPQEVNKRRSERLRNKEYLKVNQEKNITQAEGSDKKEINNKNKKKLNKLKKIRNYNKEESEDSEDECDAR